MSKTLCIYHAVDADGVFSALITSHWYKLTYGEGRENDLILSGWNYGDRIPEVLNNVKFNTIILVDIVLPGPVMKSLVSTPVKIIWVDHHIGNIELSKKYGFDHVGGIREVGRGACELCWEYFFPDYREQGTGAKSPEVIRKLSAYDVWDKNRFNWKEEVLPIQFGLRTLYGISVQTIKPIFDRLISNDRDCGTLTNIITSGKTVMTYESKRHRSAVNTYSFPVTVAGRYKGVCCLTTDSGSNMFSSVMKDYDIYICVNRKTIAATGQVGFSISMYSEPNRVDLDLSKYMSENYNGGGHFCAAGGVLTPKQFERLVLRSEV